MRSRAGTLTSLGAVAVAAVLITGGGSASTGPSKTPTSTQNSPGWYPNVDPESMSVVLGRRTSAPVVKEPFTGGARSLDELGRRICSAIHHDAADSVLALCITEKEFRDILWREFPQSRPATGLTWQDGWSALSQRLYGGCNSAVDDYGGHYFQFLRFERTDTTTVYRNFKLHNGLVLVAKNDQGQVERFQWLRSVAERKGRFKIYSLRD